MKFFGLCGVLLAAGLATGGAKAQDAAVKELIPTGKLRFGVAFAPKMSALFVVKDAGGTPPPRHGCGRESNGGPRCDGAFGSPHTGPPPAKRISIETVIRQLEDNLLPNLAAAHRVWTLPQVCPNTRNQFL
jgi:hypothetical protein